VQITRSSIDTTKGPGHWFTGDVSTSTRSRLPRRRRACRPTSCTSCRGPHPLAPPPLGQTVFVTEGIGLCQRRGGPVEIIRPGDRVLFEANEEHWHGAAPNRLMVHLAINEADEEHDVVHWLTPVTDEEYAAAPPLA
jgi:hypothetical protein